MNLRLFEAKSAPDLRSALLNGRLIESIESDNLVVTGGLNILAQTLNWAMIQNYNVSWGSPYTALSNLGDIYGAVGTSSTAAAGGQTTLVAEIGRSIITNGAFSANQLVYDFFLGTTQANGTLVEAGMFVQSGQTTTTLTTALTLNQSYTSLSVAALGAQIPSGSTLIIGYGTTTTQYVTTSAVANAGATIISVTSFVANANYGSSTSVNYTFGTMLDRSVFAGITKTSSMTGILEVTLTLISG